MTRRVLVVDDDAEVREALGQTLDLADFDALTAGSFVEAKDHITDGFDGVILSDVRMPGRDGFHLLGYAQEQDADLPVILLTGEGDIPMAVRAMGEGAFGFLEKPCSAAELTAIITRAMAARALVLEDRALRVARERGDPAARMLFGASAASEDMRARVRAAARAGTDVLIGGGPGSGVSKVAEVIHLSSARAKAPFEKRAASGLTRDGLAQVWQASQGGTLFLDEIGGASDDVQLALLDLMEQGGAVLIGGSTEDLAGRVAAGSFSADLYYRLEVCRVRIPMLDERPEDIPVLFNHYVSQAAEQAGIEPPLVTPDHMAGLMAQRWPGNARSLMSAAMRFVLGMPEDLSKTRDLGLAEQMAQVEKMLLASALGRHNGKASEAAKALKLPRKTFYDKLAKYDLKPEAFRREG
ncbi:sigma-54-dependent transcriptional regulator [Pacificoceanicola onchidii]|uniref:sigma-54-dependent transcriptional regulator n=1 Tax=Pacificoceanicola onchidii TaxID=2562685 RepID=UPI0010A5BC66|nr:sigma-54 dependent transcriptional regulator [Pacificoceanicola onchidii]